MTRFERQRQHYIVCMLDARPVVLREVERAEAAAQEQSLGGLDDNLNAEYYREGGMPGSCVLVRGHRRQALIAARIVNEDPDPNFDSSPPELCYSSSDKDEAPTRRRRLEEVPGWAESTLRQPLTTGAHEEHLSWNLDMQKRFRRVAELFDGTIEGWAGMSQYRIYVDLPILCPIRPLQPSFALGF